MFLNSSHTGAFDPVRAEWARRPEPAPRDDGAGSQRRGAATATPSPAAIGGGRRRLLAIGAWLAALPPDFDAGE